MIKSTSLILVSALLLGGCALDTGRSIASVHDDNIYQFYNYAVADGELRTEVSGTPFDTANDGALREAVIDWMQGQLWGPDVTLTTADTKNPSLRLVVRLNPDKAVHTGTVCGADAHAAASGEELHMIMAFCTGAEAKSTVETWMPQPTGQDDPAFRNAVQLAARNLIPSSDPKDHRNCNAIECP